MLSSALLALALSAGPAPIPIFDGRLNPKPAVVSAADLALLKKEALPAARKAAGKDAACEGKLEAVDVAAGAFTRAGASQKLVLYRYCVTGPGFGRSGVAVIDEGRVVAHFAFDSSGEHALGVLRDLDGDGLSEIVLAGGGTNMGQTVEYATILGWGPAGPRKLGTLQAYGDDCGYQGKGRAAYRLFAVPGPKPSFQQQEFKGPCEGNAWKKSGAQEPVAPEADERHYELLAGAGG
jgi:hypothetical protein